jgi:hypothetical protein
MGKKIKIWDGTAWESIAIGIPNAVSTSGGSTISASNASTVPLKISGAESQTADLIQFNNSAGTKLMSYNGSTLSLKTTTFPAIYLQRYGTSGASIGLDFIKSDSNALDVDTSVASGSKLFDIRSVGYDGTSYGVIATSISGWVDGTVSTNTVPGRLIFSTSSSSGTLTERMRIDSAGNIGIGVSAPSAKLDVAGNILLSGQSTGEQYIRLGYGRSGNGYSYIDLQGDSTYINGLRLIRTNAGANSASNIEHRGTGKLQIITQEAGAISFITNATGGGAERVNISSDGKVFMNSTFSVTGANWDAGMLQLTGTSAAANNPGLSWHAPGASAMAIWHPRGGQALRIMGNTGGVENGAPSIRNITTSTSTASGGSDGDVWLTYTA